MRSVYLLAVAAVAVLIAASMGGFDGSDRPDGKPSDAVFDWLTVRAVVGEGDPHDPISTLAAAHLETTQAYADAPHPRLPGALLLQSPLSAVAVDWARPITNALTVVAAAVLAWAVVHVADLPGWLIVPVGAVLAVSPFYRSAIVVGSQGVIVAALVGVSWVASRSKDRLTCGIGLGVAATLKVFPGLLIVMLWAAGKRRVAAGAAVTVAGLNVAGVALPDVALVATVDAMAESARHVGTLPANLSMRLPLWVVLGAVAGLIWVSRRLPTDAVIAVGVVAMLALSPTVWSHYLLILALPAAWAYRMISTSPTKIQSPLGPRLSVHRQ